MSPYTPVHRLLRRILVGAVEMRWQWAALVTGLHALATYAGFAALGEVVLIESAIQFFYFYVVTGSTVGYGDFSPTTDGGKAFAAAFVIPGAIALFALLLGKAIATITTAMRKIMHGSGDFSGKSGHVVVVGHVPGQTEMLLEEAARLRGNRDVVIVATEDLSGRQDEWIFVRAAALSNRDDLVRAGIAGAGYIVILGRDDDESLAASMAVGALKPKGHVVAYFQEAGPAQIVESYCPEIETIVSISVQMVARALVDPGAGVVFQALASTKTGPTLYSARLKAAAGATMESIRKAVSARGANLVGYRVSGEETPQMLWSDTLQLSQGDTVYYVSNARLGDEIEMP